MALVNLRPLVVEGPPREVEANVCGTLHPEDGYTRVVVTPIDLPKLIAQAV